MGKVKLTQEQADAVERLKGEQREAFESHKHLLLGWAQSLNSLTADEYMDALYEGYEVEPEFKVGDWVSVSWCDEKPTIHKVVEPVKYNSLGIDGEQINKHPFIKVVRHATPEEIAEEKERRWWARHDRGVREFRIGDILFSPQTKLTYEIVDLTDYGMRFTNDTGFRCRKIIEVNYKVVCFAEDRKDV